MPSDMQNEILYEELLIAGHVRDGRKWDAHQVGMCGLQVLDKLACTINENIKNDPPDFICAIRGTGLPLGVLLHVKSGTKLMWFRDASVNELFPRYINLFGQKVVVVDSHMITGLNMLRHIYLLEALGATVKTAWVLLDIDCYRCQAEMENLRRLNTAIESIWRWSALRDIAKESINPTIREVVQYDADKGPLYWR